MPFVIFHLFGFAAAREHTIPVRLDVGVLSWTVRCADGKVHSGLSPFRGEVDASLGVSCSLSFDFNVTEETAISVLGSLDASIVRPAVLKTPSNHRCLIARLHCVNLAY